jgi:hypothetical protein
VRRLFVGRKLFCYVPLLRSRKDKRYNIDTAGRRRISNFRRRVFSLIALGGVSRSEDRVGEVEVVGEVGFSAMVVI